MNKRLLMLLTALSVFNTLSITYLLFFDQNQKSSVQVEVEDLAAPQKVQDHPNAQNSEDYARLRAVIREEMQNIRQVVSRENQRDSDNAANRISRPHDELYQAQAQRRREELEYQIEAFADAGTIDGSQFNGLLNNLEKLPKSERRVVMKKLAQAVNRQYLRIEQ